MVDLFKEVIPSLLERNDKIIDNDNEKEYDPFMTNRALSQHIDCILFTNEMNQCSFLDKKLQYDFYYHVLPKKKRKFQKWAKASQESVDLKSVVEFYGYSYSKAKDALRILSREQLDYIKSMVDKGGVVK